jgi:hypothetical protein
MEVPPGKSRKRIVGIICVALVVVVGVTIVVFTSGNKPPVKQSKCETFAIFCSKSTQISYLRSLESPFNTPIPKNVGVIGIVVRSANHTLSIKESGLSATSAKPGSYVFTNRLDFGSPGATVKVEITPHTLYSGSENIQDAKGSTVIAVGTKSGANLEAAAVYDFASVGQSESSDSNTAVTLPDRRRVAKPASSAPVAQSPHTTNPERPSTQAGFVDPEIVFAADGGVGHWSWKGQLLSIPLSSCGSTLVLEASVVATLGFGWRFPFAVSGGTPDGPLELNQQGDIAVHIAPSDSGADFTQGVGLGGDMTLQLNACGLGNYAIAGVGIGMSMATKTSEIPFPTGGFKTEPVGPCPEVSLGPTGVELPGFGLEPFTSGKASESVSGPKVWSVAICGAATLFGASVNGNARATGGTGFAGAISQSGDGTPDNESLFGTPSSDVVHLVLSDFRFPVKVTTGLVMNATYLGKTDSLDINPENSPLLSDDFTKFAAQPFAVAMNFPVGGTTATTSETATTFAAGETTTTEPSVSVTTQPLPPTTTQHVPTTTRPVTTTSRPVTVTTRPPSSDDYYLHWNCGNQAQCADVFGSNTGIQIGPITQSSCDADLTTWSNNGTMQPYDPSEGIGAWCDQSNDPNETSPS